MMIGPSSLFIKGPLISGKEYCNGQVGWLIGDIACLLVLIIFLPVLPVLMPYDDIRRMHEDG